MSLDTSAAPLGARNATLTDLAVLLRDQQARKVDVVASSAAIRARHGQLIVDGTAPVLGEDGVTLTTGTYTPTNVCDQGVADKLGSPSLTCGAPVRSARTCTTPTSTAGWTATSAGSCSAACAGTTGRAWPGRSCRMGTSSSTTWTC
jgi:hypothetical protein